MPPVPIPFARQQPYDNRAYVQAMADLMMRQGELAAAARYARGQNTQQAWNQAGNTIMATFAGIGQQRDEERDRAMRQAQLDREHAMRQQEMQERAKERAADQAWRQQQFEAEQRRYRGVEAQQASEDVLPGTEVDAETFKALYEGHPAARRFRQIPGIEAQPAWEVPGIGDAMAEAGPAMPAVPMRYLRKPNAQETIALQNAELAKQDRATRDAQFTIEQGATLEQRRQAQANADRAYAQEERQFGITEKRLSDKDKRDTFTAGANFGVTGEEFLTQLPAQAQQLVKKIANYEVDITKVTSLRGDQRQRMAELVMQYDPTFDMSMYPTRVALRRDFTIGKTGMNTRQLNTAVGHLEDLQKAAKGLNNSNWQILNKGKNWALTQSGDPRVTSFLTDANAVEGELAAVFKGMGATDQEIQAWREVINTNMSPVQLDAFVTGAVKLMGSRLGALTHQYEVGMGKPKDFNLLSGKTRQILKKMGFDPNTMEPESDPNTTTVYNPEQSMGGGGGWFNQQRQSTPSSPFGPQQPLGLPMADPTQPRPLFGPRPGG